MSKITLSREDIVRLCERIEGAQTRAYAIPKLTDEYPDMTIADGYAVQSELRRRFIAAGHKLIGWKAGLTSKAKMQQMGVSVPSVRPSALFVTHRVLRSQDGTTCWGFLPTLNRSITLYVAGSITWTSWDFTFGT